MKLYYIITDSQKILEETFFLPSIKIDNKINPIPIYYNPEKSNIGNFCDHDYLDTLLFRNQTIIDLIEDNMGENIIISDVDIVTVKPFLDYIEDNIKNKDILHMRDGIDGVNIINGGFTILNCNLKVKKMYEHILKKCINSKKLYIDQDAIKDYYYVEDNFLDIKWDYLPASMFAVRYEWNFLEKNKNNLVMFHATNTLPYGNISSVQRKIHYLEMFKKWHNNEIGKFYE